MEVSRQYGRDQEPYQLPQGCGPDPPLKVEQEQPPTLSSPPLLLLTRTQETEALMTPQPTRGDIKALRGSLSLSADRQVTRQLFVPLHTFYSGRCCFPPVIRCGTDKPTGEAGGAQLLVRSLMCLKAKLQKQTSPNRLFLIELHNQRTHHDSGYLPTSLEPRLTTRWWCSTHVCPLSIPGHTIARVDDVCPHGSALTVKFRCFKRNLQQEKLLLIMMESSLSWSKLAVSFLSLHY